jgi:hypothetical protein
MAYAETHTVTIVTDTSGDAIGYTPNVTGRVINIIYTKPSSGGYAAGVDFAITAENSGINLWTESDVNASKTVSPRQPTHTQVGVENDTAGDALLGEIYLTNERVKIVVDDGGDTLTGTFKVIVGG